MGAVLVSSALIAWSLVSLYGPLEYQDDYLEEDYEPLDDGGQQEASPTRVDSETINRSGAAGSTPDAKPTQIQ